jgi:hypothetical protein
MSVTLIRNIPLYVPHATWVNVPMNTFGGGDRSLFNNGYVLGQPGSWLFGAYVRIAASASNQIIIRFVRDITGQPDSTGAQDWAATPGKDFISHVWFFNPAVNKPNGFQIYQTSDRTDSQSFGGGVTIEYAQLKAHKL